MMGVGDSRFPILEFRILVWRMGAGHEMHMNGT